MRLIQFPAFPPPTLIAPTWKQRLWKACCHAALWCRRIRYRRGYNIHSPYAFHWVTRVFYDRCRYPAYAILPPPSSIYSRRVLRLTYRIARELQAQEVWGLGKLSVPLLASMQAALSREATVHVLEPASSEVRDECTLPAPDLVGASLLEWSASDLLPVFPLMGPKALFVLHGIHANAQAYAQWQRLLQASCVRVSFDLYEVGILSFEQRLNKQDYLINF